MVNNNSMNIISIGTARRTTYLARERLRCGHVGARGDDLVEVLQLLLVELRVNSSQSPGSTLDTLGSTKSLAGPVTRNQH